MATSENNPLFLYKSSAVLLGTLIRVGLDQINGFFRKNILYLMIIALLSKHREFSYGRITSLEQCIVDFKKYRTNQGNLEMGFGKFKIQKILTISLIFYLVNK